MFCYFVLYYHAIDYLTIIYLGIPQNKKVFNVCNGFHESLKIAIL